MLACLVLGVVAACSGGGGGGGDDDDDDGATPTPTLPPITVNAQVVSALGDPIAGASVSVGGMPYVTDATGRLVALNVTPPYEILLDVSDCDDVIGWAGVMRDDPVLRSCEQAGGNEAFVTGGFVNANGTSIGVVPPALLANTSVDGSTYETDVFWPSAAGVTTAVLVAFGDFSVPQIGRVVVTLADGGDIEADFEMSSGSADTVSGTVVVPAEYEMNALWSIVARERVTLDYYRNTADTTFSLDSVGGEGMETLLELTVDAPSLPGTPSARLSRWVATDASGVVLEPPQSVVLTAPLTAAVLATGDTIAWSTPAGVDDLVYRVELVETVKGGAMVSFYTDETSARVPSLAGLGRAYWPSSPAFVRVYAHSPAQTVDEMLGPQAPPPYGRTDHLLLSSGPIFVELAP